MHLPTSRPFCVCGRLGGKSFSETQQSDALVCQDCNEQVDHLAGLLEQHDGEEDTGKVLGLGVDVKLDFAVDRLDQSWVYWPEVTWIVEMSTVVQPSVKTEVVGAAAVLSTHVTIELAWIVEDKHRGPAECEDWGSCGCCSPFHTHHNRTRLNCRDEHSGPAEREDWGSWSCCSPFHTRHNRTRLNCRDKHRGPAEREDWGSWSCCSPFHTRHNRTRLNCRDEHSGPAEREDWGSWSCCSPFHTRHNRTRLNCRDEHSGPAEREDWGSWSCCSPFHTRHNRTRLNCRDKHHGPAEREDWGSCGCCSPFHTRHNRTRLNCRDKHRGPAEHEDWGSCGCCSPFHTRHNRTRLNCRHEHRGPAEREDWGSCGCCRNVTELYVHLLFLKIYIVNWADLHWVKPIFHFLWNDEWFTNLLEHTHTSHLVYKSMTEQNCSLWFAAVLFPHTGIKFSHEPSLELVCENTVFIGFGSNLFQ